MIWELWHRFSLGINACTCCGMRPVIGSLSNSPQQVTNTRRTRMPSFLSSWRISPTLYRFLQTGQSHWWGYSYASKLWSRKYCKPAYTSNTARNWWQMREPPLSLYYCARRENTDTWRTVPWWVPRSQGRVGGWQASCRERKGTRQLWQSSRRLWAVCSDKESSAQWVFPPTSVAWSRRSWSQRTRDRRLKLNIPSVRRAIFLSKELRRSTGSQTATDKPP